MKSIFIRRDVSTGETVATGVTGVHESPLHSAMVNSVAQRSVAPFTVAGDLTSSRARSATVTGSAELCRHVLDNL